MQENVLFLNKLMYLAVLKRITYYLLMLSKSKSNEIQFMLFTMYTNSIVYKPTQFPALLNGRNIILLWKFYRTGITLLQFWIHSTYICTIVFPVSFYMMIRVTPIGSTFEFQSEPLGTFRHWYKTLKNTFCLVLALTETRGKPFEVGISQ